LPKVLLQINELHKSYGAHVILDGASAAFSENQKVGIIGRNGAGKSTLCKILINQEESDGGSIFRSPELRLSYLEQHDSFKLDETVIEFLMRYTGQEEWKCGKVAGRFQLKNELLKTKIGALSGGYRTRVKLASMLLAEPNFLILDEPTNYLDLKTLILLENFLKEYDGAFLIVSHDREFLKKTCEDTLEVENGQCTLYPGSVEDYLIFKEEQKGQAESYNRNVEVKQKQLQAFIDRFRAKASKASQAKSKMKQLERMKKIDVDHPLANVHIRIPQVERKNAPAVDCSNLAIGYPDKVVASNINLEIQQGSHVAVLGENGQGKTTFLRTLAGGLDTKFGKVRWGYNLKVAYYAQHVFSELSGDGDIYTYLSAKAAPEVMRQEILNLAGSLLFKGDDVKKRLSVLSGGERARVCLAGLLLSKSHVLLLDEPTNHLDFETVEALGHALRTFAGTIFFVSHDRTFVNLIANEIVEVNGGAVIRYPGTYEEYVDRLQMQVEEELVETDAAATAAAKPKSAYHLKKEMESERRKLTSRLKKTEEQIEACKKERDAIHEIFMNDSSAWSRERSDRYEEAVKLIAENERLWLELTEKLDLLGRGQGAS